MSTGMSTRSLQRGTGTVVLNALGLIVSVSGLAPLIWMIYSSLKTDTDFLVNPVGLPRQLEFGNYVDAVVIGRMNQYFLNSVFNTVFAVSLSVLVGFTIAYFLARVRFRGRNLLYAYFVSGMTIPIYALLIPIFIQFTWLGLTNGRLTLILPYISFALPTVVFLSEGYLRSVPVEMEEAAYVDGASLHTTIFSVVLPMCRPIIATVIVLSFIASWNEFPLALVLVSSRKFITLPVGLTHFFGEHSAQYTRLFAALMIITTPAVLVYLAFQKYVIRGMTAGALKG